MKNLEIIMLPVKDQQKAKTVYLKLGFKVIVEAPGEHGETWLQMGLPNQKTSITFATFHGIICETDNVDNEMKVLKTKGIEIERIEKTPWGRYAWMKVADGNGICLHQK